MNPEGCGISDFNLAPRLVRGRHGAVDSRKWAALEILPDDISFGGSLRRTNGQAKQQPLLLYLLFALRTVSLLSWKQRTTGAIRHHQEPLETFKTQRLATSPNLTVSISIPQTALTFPHPRVSDQLPKISGVYENI